MGPQGVTQATGTTPLPPARRPPAAPTAEPSPSQVGEYGNVGLLERNPDSLPSDPEASRQLASNQAQTAREMAGESGGSHLSRVGDATELHERYQRGEISEEEFREGIRDFYARCYDAYRKDEAERSARELEETNRNHRIEGGQRRIDRIVDTRDDRVRNLRITQSYSELSQGMRDVLGTDAGANWATWATWASKQAGSTVRQEDVPGGRITATVVDALTPIMAPSMRGQMDHSSRQVAAGNRKVYQEVAPCFSSFIETFKGDERFDQNKLDRYLERPEFQDKPWLKKAFGNYYQAMHADDPDRKQELTLLGNMQIGYHEQTRLQPDIEGALPYGGRKLATWGLMELNLPGETLELGDDLPARNGRSFPRNLSRLDHPELRQLVSQVDGNPYSLAESGASDWTNFDERMNFIADLFRSRHDDPSLFNAPFTAQQTREIAAGRVPDGPL